MNTEDGIDDNEAGGKEPSNRLLPVRESDAVTIVPDIEEAAGNQSDSNDGNKTKNGSCLWRIVSGIAPTEMCPIMTKLHYVATRLEIYALVGALIYVIISFPWAEPIREAVLQLTALFVVAQIFGILVGLVRLPPLLGMLLAGILLRYLDIFHAKNAFLEFTATVRSCAMSIILLRAGLGLNPTALRRLSMVVMRMAVVPCTLEAVAVAVVSHYLLNFPWQWGFLLGFILGAVSPAVVVPTILWLKSQGYGEDKGISTLVIAASSLDDIFAITMFGVFLSMIFAQGSISVTILQGPLEIIIGVTWGILLGVISIYIPHSGEKSVALLRTIMVVASGIVAVLGSQLIGYAGAGPLGCLVGAFVASCGWREFSHKSSYEPVTKSLSNCWIFLQPFLFGLIGTEINLSAISPKNAGLSIAVMLVGLVARVLACGISALGSGLNFKEIIFVSLSWLPKATVQAAIGPVALDLVRSGENSTDGKMELAEQVLMIAVLSILVTAPLGAIGILATGPKLLTKISSEENAIKRQPEEDEQVDVELETL